MASITERDDEFWVVYEENELQLATDYEDGPHKTRREAEVALEGITRATAASRTMTSEGDRHARNERTITD